MAQDGKGDSVYALVSLPVLERISVDESAHVEHSFAHTMALRVYVYQYLIEVSLRKIHCKSALWLRFYWFQ